MKSEINKTDMHVARYIGTRIKRCRETGMQSQREIAEKAGITQANLALIENAKANPTLYTLARIADALSMELAFDLRRRLGSR